MTQLVQTGSGLRALLATPAFLRLWAIGGCVNTTRFFELLSAALFTLDVTGSGLAVADEKPDAIGIICTNLAAAPLVAGLEAATGIPIYDTIATAVWKSLRLAGVDPRGITGWGRLFSL